MITTREIGMPTTEDHDSSQEVKLWLRSSQLRINHCLPLDPMHLCLNVLRVPHPESPAYLSYDLIMILSENGVPDDAFHHLIRCSTQKALEPLRAWLCPDSEEESVSLFKLRVAISRAGEVLQARQKRARVFTETHLRGYGAQPGDEDLNEDITVASSEWLDNTSGCPSSPGETAVSLLDSGFDPASCPYLLGKIDNFFKTMITSVSAHDKIEVPMSTKAFMIPG